MKVYLIRHGETYGNLNKVTQGWTDVSLTEKGFKQAKRARKAVEDTKFDKIYSSDLLRTRQTAHTIFGEDADIIWDERLREVNNTVIAGRSRDELIAEYGDDYEMARKYLDFSFCGGEGAESILARTRSFLDFLATDKTSEKVAVVTHGGTIRYIIANIFGCTMLTSTMQINNCSISELEYTENGGWTLVHINNKTEL